MICPKLVLVVAFALLTHHCRFFSRSSKNLTRNSSGNWPDLPFERAAQANDAGLNQIYGLSSSHPASPVRPDPDLFGRRLLRQFRPENSTLSKAIGSVEAFRSLMGGASLDFKVLAQETYDATSLLAVQKVSETLCESLVSPNSQTYPGWQSILEHPTDSSRENIISLFSQLTGVQKSDVDDTVISELQTIVQISTDGGKVTQQSYIPVCVAILTDAQSLLL